MNKWKGIPLIVTLCAVITCIAGLLLWYQPWRHWEMDQLTQQLVDANPDVREQAINVLKTWPTIQQQHLLKTQQVFVLSYYENSINNAILQGQGRDAQRWLMDLQKLYPYLPQVQTAQQQVSFHLAQQINMTVSRINTLLETHQLLTLKTLDDITYWQNELRMLAPEHPLVNDPRVFYLVLDSIDNALIYQDFILAEKFVQWTQARFPNQVSLIDREIQIAYRLPGEPVQTLVTCISQGKGCWKFISATPLLSQPWIVQQSFDYPWLIDWNLIPILQIEIGHYYRQRALKAYETREPMLAAVDLLRAAYYTPPTELDGYWQWLVRAFIERKQYEIQQAQIAQLAGLQHTLMTQLAAFDLQDAQRSILKLQTEGADSFFVEGIALPLLGDTYLDLAEQLAQTQQYALAVRVLHAGQHFLPRNNEIKLLLAEYTALAQEPPGVSNVDLKNETDAMQKIWIQEYANALAADPEFVEESIPTVDEIKDPCKSILNTVTNSHSGVCQDQLADQTVGPALIVVPSNSKFKPFAIGKFPITLREYNIYCKISRACTLREIPKEDSRALIKKTKSDLTSDMDLSDVHAVMQDYDSFCESTGSCSTIEPQSQDLPITNLTYTEATKYAQWLTASTGQTYRLPSLEEWKYALYANHSTYACSYDTLLGLPNKIVPVQRGTMNEWNIAYQLRSLREWVKNANGFSIVGPEKPNELPACTVLLNNATNASLKEGDLGVRLIREIR